MILNSKTTRVNVISQNMLHDVTRTNQGLIAAQDERVQGIAANILSFNGSLDVVAIQEAYKSDNQHNGEVLAALAGHWPGVWARHNEKAYPGARRGRANEYIGLFGEMVDASNTWTMELGDHRRAVVTEIAGVAFAAVHLRAGIGKTRRLRHEQAKQLLHALEAYESAVILGDFNEPPVRWLAKGRDELRKNGFHSVFSQTQQSHPKTFPTEPYGPIYGMKSRWALDDIMVRGTKVQILAAGVLSQVAPQSSDHKGVWATLEIAP